MKNLIKITLTLLIGIIMSVGIFIPGLLMGTPASPAIGNWYQQFIPSIGSRTILDITFLDSLTGYSITTISSDTSYILKTTNSGDNWVVNFRAPSSIFRRVQFINNNTGYVGGQNLFKTTNAGGNWNIIYPSLFSEDMYFMDIDTGWYVDPNSLVGGVFRTTNGGASWQQQLNIGSQNPNHIYFYNGRLGFIAKDNVYLRRTTDGGGNWNVITGTGGFTDMYFKDSLTGWKTSFQKTTNGGLNWVNQTIPTGGNIILSQIDKFSVLGSDTIWGVGSTIFLPGQGNRGIIYRSTNSGNTWQFQVPDTSIQIGRYLFTKFTSSFNGWAYTSIPTGVHTTNGGDPIWLTGITQINTEVPKEFKLYQNYPNPFNPKTKIKFQLTKRSYTEITIYDITGRKIQKLLNDELNAGVYQTDWNAAGLASGIYFCTLTVITGKEVFTDTKKMILIK